MTENYIIIILDKKGNTGMSVLAENIARYMDVKK